MTGQEFLKKLMDSDSRDEVIGHIADFEKSVWNEAIDAANENARIKFIPFSDNMEVNQESILKLKK